MRPAGSNGMQALSPKEVHDGFFTFPRGLPAPPVALPHQESSTAMTFNLALANQVLEHIEANPETWNQETWRCKTGMCFAGWAAELSGATWRPDRVWEENFITHRIPRETVTTPDGRTMHCSDYAAEVLGLGKVEYGSNHCQPLFDPFNTLNGLKEMVAKLAAKDTERVQA